MGLPDSEVISVIQTHDGCLWLGTLHGLVRFDGIKFTVFNENNTPGLTSDRIVYLFEDNETNLWVGTESSGLLVIKDGRIRNFESEGGGGNLIYAYEDTATNIWFYTADGHSYRYHNGQMDFHSAVLSAQLLFRATRIQVPGKSGFWQIMNGTVQKWQDNQPEKNYGPCPWGLTIVTAACEDKDGNLIVGTKDAGGFWYRADGKCWHISTEQGLSSPYVLSLCLDREGDLWVGTDGNGLDRIKRKTFDTPVELHPWAAQSFAADHQGGLWTAFNAHGMSYWTTNAVQDFAVGQLSNAWTVLVDKEQRVWAGTRDEGLFQFQDNHFQTAPGTAILGPTIFALFEDQDGQIWAGTKSGLANFDGQSWKLFTTRDGLSENAVRAIAQDAGGNLWVGTESSGLNLFKDGKFTAYRAGENGLPGDDISCLYADKDDALWIGTSGHGLARLRDGKWARYSTKDGLASDSISYITEDDAGYLWIGSNAGLMRVPKNSLNEFGDGTTNVISCRIYGKADGLPTRECSAGSQPATCRTADGRLWFPTIKGLVSVNPADLKPHLQPPTVMIESALVDGREQNTNRLDSAWQPSVTIPPGGEELEIHYTALNFSAPELVRFKCWLEGHETSWSEASDERVARYPKLPPGHYRFHVEACNEDNVWSGPDAAVLAITVQPQFWQTGWFRVSVILCLLWNRCRRGAIRFHPEAATAVANASSNARRWKKNAPASPATFTTSSAQTSRRWRCWAKWPKPTRIRRRKLNRTRSRFPRPRAKQHVRWTKSSGRSIPQTTRWTASSTTPANTRRNISRWPDCAAALICRRNCPRFRFRRKSATTSFSPSRRPSTTSSSTRRRPRPGFDCVWSRNISFWKLKTMAAASESGLRNKTGTACAT